MKQTDAKQLADLRRVQFLATTLLGGCLTTLVAAKWFEPRYPGLAYVAAFAEAATIGGFADWYAVVALFRRPLGLPIPHTAILPSNQERVADSLGDFIETNFLAEAPVRKKLEETDFAALIIDWLTDETRAAALAGFAVRMLPQAMNAADASRLKTFMAERMQDAVSKVNVAPWAANLLGGLTEGRRHQKFLDELLDVLGRLLLEPRSVEMILEKIREELPSVLRTLGADGFLLRKIVGSAAALIAEVKATPDHALRGEVDRLVQNFVTKLRTSKVYQRKLDEFKNSLLNRPETAELFQIAWDSIKTFVERDVTSENSVLQQKVAGILVSAAHQLGEDAALRAELNAGMVTVLTTFIGKQKSAISKFVSGQVKSWDMEHMTTIVETKIGRDLQYIRFNGTLIGGLIGLLLYIGLHAAGLR